MSSAIWQGIKGRVELEIVEFQQGDLSQQVLFEGELISKGAPVAQFREDFDGKNEGYLLNPYTNETLLFSLRPWQYKNPDTTFLKIVWHFLPEEDIRPGDPRYPIL